MLNRIFFFITIVTIGLSFGNDPSLAQPPGEINAKMAISFARIRYPALQNEQAAAD
ncbi:MAG TPA: hypothetical protein VF480_02790 [Verrucomicrobiae bacterium]